MRCENLITHATVWSRVVTFGGVILCIILLWCGFVVSCTASGVATGGAS